MKGQAVLPSHDEKSTYVNEMFAQIASTYDVMNRVMTGGMDVRWRKEVIDLCELPPHGKLLDVGTGTGDIAYEAMQRQPSTAAFGADFTIEMMQAGVGKIAGQYLPFTQADALNLPYADNTFDAVVSGFLIRNVVDSVTAFREQQRVLKPGGRVVCLETAPPSNTVLGPLFQFYFFNVVPIIGSLISDYGKAYSYLPHSTVNFPSPEKLKLQMEQAGLRHVTYQEKMFGTVAIHIGMK
ncbi:MAG: ubiquinone/menaquinone biosynthesis methyltransferase [Chloroflexota bacterium]